MLSISGQAVVNRHKTDTPSSKQARHPGLAKNTQTCSGTYLTLPTVVLNFGESASGGTGTMISTLLAVERRLNCEREKGRIDDVMS